MDELEIPSHFICPISMQLMRDPVIVSTGITYDRESIERWLFSRKNNTCPVTKQVLFDTDLTPNHTLRRLIQAWCILNEAHGVERVPTPKPPVDKAKIVIIIQEATKYPQKLLECLQKLRFIAQGSESNKKCMKAAGVIDFLDKIVKKNGPECFVLCNDCSEFNKPIDEALSILFHLDASEASLKKLVGSDGEFVDSLMRVLECGNYQTRAYAIMLLKCMFDVADPAQLIGVRRELFDETIKILSEKVSQQASMAALKLLVKLCPWGRNRIKAVEAGAVSVLIELLLDTLERRACELVMVVLDQLCGCAEGRAELLKHGAGLAIVSKKILRVSHVVSDRSVRILSSISRFSATSRVLQEMLQVGVVSKLCLVLQVHCSDKTKVRANQILRLHSRVWKDSTCVPAHLLSSYLSS